MKPTVCPICRRQIPPGVELVCPSCGADLSDPDVLAMSRLAGEAEAGARAAASDPRVSLASDRFLGVSASALAEGGNRLALVGAGLYLAAFVMPVAQSWRGYTMSWEALENGPTVALLIPLFSAVLGLVVAFLPGLSSTLRAGLLGVIGVAGLIFGLGPLGEFALTQRTLLSPLTLAVLVAGVAGVLRLQRPDSKLARWALVAALPIALAGYLIPAALDQRLPLEFVDYRNALDLKLDSAVPLVTLWKAADHRAAPILFISLWALAPLVLLPVVAALAWRPPRDLWDRTGVGLRPLVAVIVLYLPLGYAIDAFNMVGWSSHAAQGLFAARLRLVVLSLPMSLWAAFGLAMLAQRRRE